MTAVSVVGECRSCHRDVILEPVTRHLDGKSKVRCSFCNSTNVRPKSVNAQNGLVFGALNLFAGVRAARAQSSEDVEK